ncbi:nucleoside triphosphate pyrophosphohydrolase [Candidatus Pacearchaeota archaeon]|nr:nucleoside triphosphate pyrophosphohydrolase [Candidatus Pacearchaeota archaeon]
MNKYDGLVKYDKLIRDRIPEKIESNGSTYKLHVANDKEYWSKLQSKIGEEVNEFLEDPSVEELADIVEVLYAIADFNFGGRKNLEEVRLRKFEKRGGFEKKLILDETDNR